VKSLVSYIRRHRWRLLGIAGAVFFVGYLLVAARVSGVWQGNETDHFRFANATEGAPEKAIAQTKQFHACHATAITGSTLTLDCGGGRYRTVVSLDSVMTLPLTHDLGKAAKEAMEQALKEKGGSDVPLVDCDPVPPQTGYVCKIGTLDLRLILLEAGLAHITSKSPPSDLHEAEVRAQQARLGLWWDWNPENPMARPDPILWRVGRDATEATEESSHTAKVQTFASFLVAVSVLASFLGFALDKHEAIGKRERRRMDLEEDLREMERDIEECIDALEKICKANISDWKTFCQSRDAFVAQYNRLDSDTSESGLSTGHLKIALQDRRLVKRIEDWKDEYLVRVKYLRELIDETVNVKPVNPEGPQGRDDETSNWKRIKSEVADHIDVWKEGRLTRWKS
jgi:hypothetical protein